MIHWVHKQVREFCHHKTKIPSSLTGAAFAPRSQTTGFIMCVVLQLWKTLFYFIFLFFNQLLIFPLPLVLARLMVAKAHHFKCGQFCFPLPHRIVQKWRESTNRTIIMCFVLAINSFRGFRSFQVTLTASYECLFTTHWQENISVQNLGWCK